MRMKRFGACGVTQSLQCFSNCIIDIPVKKKRKGIQRRQLTYGMGQSLKYVYFYQILHISMML